MIPRNLGFTGKLCSMKRDVMMEIKFKESGFCGTLEESYMTQREADNRELRENLFTKKKMTDDELHDLLTWNTAAHLELHAF